MKVEKKVYEHHSSEMKGTKEIKSVDIMLFGLTKLNPCKTIYLYRTYILFIEIVLAFAFLIIVKAGVDIDMMMFFERLLISCEMKAEDFVKFVASIKSIICLKDDYDMFPLFFENRSFAYYDAASKNNGLLDSEKDLIKVLDERNLAKMLQQLIDDLKLIASQDNRQSYLNNLKKLVIRDFKSHEIFSLIKTDLSSILKETVIKYWPESSNFHSMYLLKYLDLYPGTFNSDVLRLFQNCDLKFILEKSIPIDKYKDNFGAQSIHLAALYGRNDLILWLCATRKSILYSTDCYGFTALHYAASNTQITTISLLKALGLNQTCAYGTKPLLNYFTKNYNDLKFDLVWDMVAVNILSLNGLSNRLPDKMDELKLQVESILSKKYFFYELS